jgi:acetylornithine deacetylase/succinyl-diaminopimelate desuccinylase-like protein
MTRQAVFDHIAAHKEDHIRRLQEYVRQPSISETDEGIAETVTMVADYLRDLGCREVEIVPTDGHPGVFAYYDAGAEKTIVNYGMYDVNAVNPGEWDHDPFSAEIIPYAGYDRVLYGRGAFFAKGPYRAWLNALESIIAIEGTLPVNIYFVVDGEEEIGSPHFHQVIDRYQERLRQADRGRGVSGAGTRRPGRHLHPHLGA